MIGVLSSKTPGKNAPRSPESKIYNISIIEIMHDNTQGIHSFSLVNDFNKIIITDTKKELPIKIDSMNRIFILSIFHHYFIKF
jgi:hypothetical protein